MKRLFACVLAAAVVLPASAFADDMGRVIASVCDYTKANDRSNLRKKLDGAGLDLRHVYDAIVCPAGDGFEGGSLLRLAAAFGSVDAATFIATKIGKNAITKPEKDGMSALDWAQKKADGGDAKVAPVLTMLKEKSS